MEKLEIELVTLSKLYPNDSVFASEVRKIVNRIRLENLKKEKSLMDEFYESIDSVKLNKNKK